jgi:hypothetical protein
MRQSNSRGLAGAAQTGVAGGECLESRTDYLGAARAVPGAGRARGLATGLGRGRGLATGLAEIRAVRKSQLFRHARPEPNTLRKRLTWYG